jgi:hypothetical protein
VGTEVSVRAAILHTDDIKWNPHRSVMQPWSAAMTYVVVLLLTSWPPMQDASDSCTMWSDLFTALYHNVHLVKELLS